MGWGWAGRRGAGGDTEGRRDPGTREIDVGTQRRRGRELRGAEQRRDTGRLRPTGSRCPVEGRAGPQARLVITTWRQGGLAQLPPSWPGHLSPPRPPVAALPDLPRPSATTGPQTPRLPPGRAGAQARFRAGYFTGYFTKQLPDPWAWLAGHKTCQVAWPRLGNGRRLLSIRACFVHRMSSATPYVTGPGLGRCPTSRQGSALRPHGLSSVPSGSGTRMLQLHPPGVPALLSQPRC